jgi:hypothetical protein
MVLFFTRWLINRLDRRNSRFILKIQQFSRNERKATLQWVFGLSGNFELDLDLYRFNWRKISDLVNVGVLQGVVLSPIEDCESFEMSSVMSSHDLKPDLPPGCLIKATLVSSTSWSHIFNWQPSTIDPVQFR